MQLSKRDLYLGCSNSHLATSCPDVTYLVDWMSNYLATKQQNKKKSMAINLPCNVTFDIERLKAAEMSDAVG